MTISLTILIMIQSQGNLCVVHHQDVHLNGCATPGHTQLVPHPTRKECLLNVLATGRYSLLCQKPVQLQVLERIRYTADILELFEGHLG